VGPVELWATKLNFCVDLVPPYGTPSCCVEISGVYLVQVSATVCFLLSPAAAFINGETIRVDGAHSLYAPSVTWQVAGL